MCKKKFTIIGGNVNSSDVFAEKKMKFLLSKNEKGSLETDIKLEDNIKAPAKLGDKVGELIYKINGAEVGRVSLIIKEDINKATWNDVVGKILRKIHLKK